MKISKFLTQQVSYEKRTGNNDYAEYTYASAISIPARIEHTTQMIERSDGSVCVAKNIIYLDTEVFVGDKIDGREILVVNDYVWRDGSIQGYEVMT